MKREREKVVATKTVSTRVAIVGKGGRCSGGNSAIDKAAYISRCTMYSEYDGQHHFYPVAFNGISEEQAKENHLATIRHDEIKNQYCKNNNIELLRISYHNFKNIDVMVRDFLIS